MGRSGTGGALRARLGLGLLGLAAVGCIAMDSPLLEESAAGCAELGSTELAAGAAVDPDVRDLMLTTAALRMAVARLRGSVLDACSRIALTLGAADTWSASPSVDQAVSNISATGACDRAATQLAGGPLRGGAVVSREGECRVDGSAQLDCERACAGREVCLERCHVTGWAEAACRRAVVEVSDALQHPELGPAAVTLEEALPVLLEAEARGELLRAGVEQLGSVATQTAEQRADDLDGKSMACAGESSSALVRELVSLELCATGSARVLLASGARGPR